MIKKILKSKKGPVLAFAIIFWAVQFILIFVTELKNPMLFSLVNFLLIIHFIIWNYIVKDVIESKQRIINFIFPIIILIIFSILPYLLGSLISGTLWIESNVFLGSFTLIIEVVYFSIKIIKKATFDNSFFKEHKRNFERIQFAPIMVSFFFLIMVILSPLIITSINYYMNDQNEEMRQLLNDITRDLENDTQKTLALLEWFDKKGHNISNIYHREGENKIVLNFANEYYIFSEEPHFGVRTGGYNPQWIFARRCGRCGEYAVLFSKMADVADLKVRKVTCLGEDHEWDEIFLDNRWVVVDPTAVNLPNSNGFDLPQSFMEDKVKGDLWSEGIFVDEGNVSYAYAIYPDDIETQIDITDRYTDIINITVLTIDSNGLPVVNVTINVISNNRLESRDTGLSNLTNEIGECRFSIGGGDYTFKARKEGQIALYGDLTDSFDEETFNHSIVIEMEVLLKGGKSMKGELIVQLLGLIGTICISLQVLLGRKWSLKFRGFWAGRISQSTQHKREMRRKLYQAFYWSWEQIFALTGLIILIIALLMALFL